ncbi:MAG TPA: hypothetical protein VEJ89_13355 [Myxococcaceae bacterium]|jgi:demethoxyubiquinone hydroxylase (CLK1/Coq7/Cat5 family)|nr:hypothetical protein [Myxococcaceae bacterium]
MDAREVQQKLKDEQARLEHGLEQAREELSEFNQRLVGVIRRRPGTCLLLALAAGFVVGRMASR